MVRPSLLNWSLAFLAALGARTASADPISLTGLVERDFDQANQSVRISPSAPIRLTSARHPG